MKRVTFELDGVALRRRAGDRERAILDGVTTTIGAAVTIVAGPSGAGKTSLLRLLNGLDSPTAGRLHCEGRDMHDWPPRDLRRRVGMVAQQPPAIAESATAELALAAELAGVDFDEAHARAVAERLDLDEALLSQHGSDLSVGERQRLAIVRALVARPAILLLDEPTSAQDTRRALAVHELLSDLVQEGLRIVVVEHRLSALRAHDDGSVHHLLLRDGRLESDGPGPPEVVEP